MKRSYNARLAYNKANSSVNIRRELQETLVERQDILDIIEGVEHASKEFMETIGRGAQ